MNKLFITIFTMALILFIGITILTSCNSQKPITISTKTCNYDSVDSKWIAKINSLKGERGIDTVKITDTLYIRSMELLTVEGSTVVSSYNTVLSKDKDKGYDKDKFVSYYNAVGKWLEAIKINNELLNKEE